MKNAQNEKLYAFWKYDVPPYLLGGEVKEIKNGYVYPVGYNGGFKAVKIVPFEKGIKLQKKLNKAFAHYRETVNEANAELKETVKKISE